ncbi:Phosphatidylglycerol/phosphatidylinositol transfer protein [Chytridiales sp. JEL 0842]|nr:Phosphatidylglycerol/phosphatidylinositol transfer protein [Chytridiales sp. JEL 0842]
MNKLITLLLSFFLALIASISAAPVTTSLAIRQDALSGFSVCSGANAGLTISSLTYTPKPPVAGQDLSVTITGDLKKVVEAGTTIRVVGKVLFITAIDTTIDLCAQNGVVCPLNEGQQSLTFSIGIPSVAPKGVTVNLKATATDAQGGELASHAAASATSAGASVTKQSKKDALSSSSRPVVAPSAEPVNANASVPKVPVKDDAGKAKTKKSSQKDKRNSKSTTPTPISTSSSTPASSSKSVTSSSTPSIPTTSASTNAASVSPLPTPNSSTPPPTSHLIPPPSPSPSPFSFSALTRSGSTTRSISRSNSPFRSMDRSRTPGGRSSSPAPSVSSTLAAERLARLTNAQVADLAGAVSAEMFRRRTPVGALLASYERLSSTHPPTSTSTTGGVQNAASRLSKMTDSQFRVLANDLESEALRRDIPGVDVLGRFKFTTLQRIHSSSSVQALNTLSNNISQGASPSVGSPLSASLERTDSYASLPTRVIPAGAGVTAASTIAHESSNSTITSGSLSGSLSGGVLQRTLMADVGMQNSLALSSSTTLDDKEKETGGVSIVVDDDRTIARSRLVYLSEDQFRKLVSDLEAEITARTPPTATTAPQQQQPPSPPPNSVEQNASEEKSKRKAAKPDQTRKSFANSVLGAMHRKPKKDSPSSSTTTPASLPLTETQRLVKVLSLKELEDLLEDVSSESVRRAQGGVVIGTTEIKPLASEEKKGGEEASTATGAGVGGEEKAGKRKEGGGKKKEGANVSAWRARIGKLSDEQLREVTVDVMDEMARRREKEVPHLQPLDDLSPKRNEARKELARLPSKELKTLWTIIYENMQKRGLMM